MSIRMSSLLRPIKVANVMKKKDAMGEGQKEEVEKYGLLPFRGGGSARVPKKPYCLLGVLI